MIKKIFKACWNWGKKHTFHFVISILLFLLCSVILEQQIKINSLQKQINNVPNLISNSEDATENLLKDLRGNIALQVESTNARIDTIDSAIEPEKKRRMLVEKIRDAITENTTRTIGVRDLNKMANAIIDYSYEFNLTIPQVLAQIKAESDFNVRAESSAHAQGLMQIRPRTLDYIGAIMPNSPTKLSPWNIYHNIRAGCFYLSEQIEEFGTYEEALRAYNWGPDNLARWNAGELKKEPEETLEYVPRIQKYIKIFKGYGLE